MDFYIIQDYDNFSNLLIVDNEELATNLINALELKVNFDNHCCNIKNKLPAPVYPKRPDFGPSPKMSEEIKYLPKDEKENHPAYQGFLIACKYFNNLKKEISQKYKADIIIYEKAYKTWYESTSNTEELNLPYLPEKYKQFVMNYNGDATSFAIEKVQML